MSKLKNYNGDKFYNGAALWKEAAPWNVVLSERSNGKSLWFLKQFVIDYFETGHKMAYVRRFDTDIKQKDVNLYFKDPNFVKWLQTGTEYSGIRCNRGELWFYKFDERGKQQDCELFGFVFALNVQEHYKSLHYDGVYNIMFEEYITNRIYIQNEFLEFNHLCSTICRSGRYRIVMLGNTIARDCPYMLEMGVDLLKTAAGHMYINHLKRQDGSSVKCVFDYALPGDHKTFFFGKAEKNIVNGEWDVEEQPLLYFDYRKAERIYKCSYITALHQGFNMEVLLYDDQKFLFVYPGKYEEIKEGFNDIFTDTADFGSGYFLKPEKKRHAKIQPLIRCRRVLFSDSLTGTEFYKALKRYNPFVL